MTDVETTGSDKDLTVAESKQESIVESTEPTGDTDLPEGSKNWQHAIQKAREREKTLQQELEEAKRKLEAIKTAEKEKKMEEMTETDRLRAIAEEESQKRGRLEMRQLILEATDGRKLPKAVKDILLRSPWSIPAVEEELGSEYTWDEAIDAVKRHLPAYLDSITAEEETTSVPSEEPVRKVDSERSAGATVVKEHFYTLDEVQRLKDQGLYDLHRDKILRQMALNGGKLG